MFDVRTGKVFGLVEAPSKEAATAQDRFEELKARVTSGRCTTEARRAPT